MGTRKLHFLLQTHLGEHRHREGREYLFGLLESPGVALSMTQRGEPDENAVAERVNGILKDEFDLADTLPFFAYG